MRDKIKKVIIVGCGAAGRLLLHDIVQNHKTISCLGYVDDLKKSNSVRILGPIRNLVELVENYRVDEILIAVPSSNGKLVRRVLLQLISTRIPIKIVPRTQMVIKTGLVRYADLREAEAQDFLGRPFIKHNIEKLSAWYKDKVVLITGGAGSIGSEIVRQLMELGTKKVIVYDFSEYLMFNLDQMLKDVGMRDKCELIIGNILNANKVSQIFKKDKPNIVIHAAAYKHVYLMEDNLDEAIINNIQGTKTITDLVIQNQISNFVFISTDKVVNASSIMGATKNLCELYIRHSYHGQKKLIFNIVRFGNVINSNGSVLPLFEKQIKERSEITVTDRKVKRFFMSTREASQLVIESTAWGIKNSIHVLDMGELLSIYEIALCTIRSRNLIPEVDVKIKFIGLRKGEKMIEELYTNRERGNLIDTKIPRVFGLEKLVLHNNKIIALEEELINLARKCNIKGIKRILNEEFPTLSKAH
ncbi:hypothetical protein A2379_02335 [Candidatus Amesbacteria bacterium RIFOXYB1_FULL_47_13]|nr:MAG: hypothetical protein A2379_02335 [Candidatus Amesbacteria bacterium RIFOXYB1_FULL_47_13]